VLAGPLFSEVVTWPVAAHLEKRSVGAQVSAVSASQCCPGRLGALEVERRIGAQAGAWGVKGLRSRTGFCSQIAGAGGVADCVLSRREGRVSCSIGGVGWWLKRVRVLEAAYQVSNSQRLRWCGFPVGEVSGLLRSRGGFGVGACRSELVSGAAALGFGVSCFVPL
jgi:hypothetical protein